MQSSHKSQRKQRKQDVKTAHEAGYYIYKSMTITPKQGPIKKQADSNWHQQLLQMQTQRFS